MSYISKSINRRLVFMFTMMTLVPLIIVTIFGGYMVVSTLVEEETIHLVACRKDKATEIYEYFNEVRNDLNVICRQKVVIDAASDAKAVNGVMKDFLNGVTAEYKFPSFLIIRANDQSAVYSSGINKAEIDELLTEPEIATACKKVIANGVMVATDYFSTKIYPNPVLFIAAPVKKEHSIVGVTLLRINTPELDEIIRANTGLGDSGEGFLVGRDNTLRSNCRFEKDFSIKKRKAGLDEVKEALNGKNTIYSGEGAHGWKAVASCGPLEMKKNTGFDLDWVIVAEGSQKEILAPIYNIVFGIVIVTVAATVLAVFFGIFMARSISAPVSKLTTRLERLAGGDLTVEELPEIGEDELGGMARSFNTMLKTLRGQVGQMQEGVQALAAAITEISSAITEMAANSSETSTSVTEISTTMEEVKQTSHMASEKAQNVADMTLQVNEVSKEGSHATMESIDGMSHIKEEMASLADSIIKLSDQTQSISDIIAAVSNIAEQSNLLAVNAAIEAAKAGEYGKGFSVVAQEVKSLSEQSKNSTRQVNAILNEIQKATSSAVMATERGSKAVDSGVKLTEAAGNAIETLADNINESTKAASQISASSRQQLTGIDQLAVALESIKEATQQNIAGVQQLEQAVASIKKLSEDIKSMTETFKVSGN